MRWAEIKPYLQKTLLSGEYNFSPQTRINISGEILEYWCAQDALVLKAMTIVVGNYLKPVLSRDCYHLAGRGGAKAPVRKMINHLTPNMHVMKSDVQSYYASIDHSILFDLLHQYIPDKFMLRLLWQYMKRTVCYGGLYWEVKRGISRGCSLSPLMGALYLKMLDDRMQETGLFYVRFMDDWVIIAPTRWKLRAAIRKVN